MFSKQICLENDSLCRVGIRYTLRKATQSLRFLSVIPACGNDWTTVFMIHKRELSDSMIESGSSLFYCVPHHQRNPDRVFRSAGFSIHFQNIPFTIRLFFRSFPPDIPRKHRIHALRFGRENPHRRIGSGRLRFGAHELVLERVFVG